MADKHEINTVINVETKVKDSSQNRTLVGVQRQLEKLVTSIRSLSDDKLLKSLPKMLKDSAGASDLFNSSLKKVNTQLAKTAKLTTDIGKNVKFNINVGGGGGVQSSVGNAMAAAGAASGKQKRVTAESAIEQAARERAAADREYEAARKEAEKLAKKAQIAAESAARKKNAEAEAENRRKTKEAERAQKKQTAEETKQQSAKKRAEEAAAKQKREKEKREEIDTRIAERKQKKQVAEEEKKQAAQRRAEESAAKQKRKKEEREETDKRIAERKAGVAERRAKAELEKENRTKLREQKKKETEQRKLLEAEATQKRIADRAEKAAKKKAEEEAAKQIRKATKLVEKRGASGLAEGEYGPALPPGFLEQRQLEEAEALTSQSKIRPNLLKYLVRGGLGLGSQGEGSATPMRRLIGAILPGSAMGGPATEGISARAFGGGVAGAGIAAAALALYSLGSLSKGIGQGVVGGATQGSQGLINALRQADGPGGSVLRPMGELMQQHYAASAPAMDLRQASDSLYLTNLLATRQARGGFFGATGGEFFRSRAAERDRRNFEARFVEDMGVHAARLGMSSTDYIRGRAEFARRAGAPRAADSDPTMRSVRRRPELFQNERDYNARLRAGAAAFRREADVEGRNYDVSMALSRVTGISTGSAADMIRAISRGAVGTDMGQKGAAAQMDATLMTIFTQAVSDGMTQADIPELLEDMIQQVKRSGEMGITTKVAGAYMSTAPTLAQAGGLTAERAYGLTGALARKGQKLAYGAKSPMDLIFLKHFGGLNLGGPISPLNYNEAVERAASAEMLQDPANMQRFLRHMRMLAGGDVEAAAGATAQSINAALGAEILSIPETRKLLRLEGEGKITRDAIKAVTDVPSATAASGMGISDVTVATADQANRIAAAGLSTVDTFRKLDESAVKLLEASTGINKAVEAFGVASGKLNDLLTYSVSGVLGLPK